MDTITQDMRFRLSLNKYRQTYIFNSVYGLKLQSDHAIIW